jgi:hypothetical protein
MNKKILFLLSLVIILGITNIGFAEDEQDADAKSGGLDVKTIYYPNANMKSIIAKYKSNNITGCLQETFSYVNKNPHDSAGYYYMALAYIKAGQVEKAQEAYDKAIEENSNTMIVSYASRGKACLSGDAEKCNPQSASQDGSESDDLDKFIYADYGNGLSPELNREIRDKKLKKLQEEINRGSVYTPSNIRDFDRSKGNSTGWAADISETPSNEEILEAIDTLKRAGLQLNVESSPSNQTDMQKVMSDPDVMSRNAEFAQLNMLLGNNNNNNSGMMNVLPYLFSQDGSVNKDINPRVIETMMTSSMLDAYNGFDNNRNNY